MSDNRFSLRKRMGVGGWDGAIYAAPHNLHDEVQIILPEGYFGDKTPWPLYIDVPEFTVVAGESWCQCEHICHVGKEPKHHGEGFVAETFPVATPFGTFHVCDACRKDCYAEFALPMMHEGNTPKNTLELAAAHPDTRHLTEVKVPMFESVADVLRMFPDAPKLFKHHLPDRSGIHADDDPGLRPGAVAPKCQTCLEPSWYLEPRELLPPGKPDAEVVILDICEACVEVAEGADPVTGAWGAASAELVIADRVRGIQK